MVQELPPKVLDRGGREDPTSESCAGDVSFLVGKNRVTGFPRTA